MITIFITAEHTYTWRTFLSTRGQAIASQVQFMTYGTSVNILSLPAGVAIFTDIDRLALLQKGAAARIHERISRVRPDIRVLNSPRDSLLRYELLSLLAERGVNRFAVHRADGPWHLARYPVFVRVANDHSAPRTTLLSSAAGVEAEIRKLIGVERWKRVRGKSGEPARDSSLDPVPSVRRDRSLAGYLSRLRRRIHMRSDILVSEFAATADVEGLYHKFGAFVVGHHIVPAHLWFSRNWVVKFASSLQEPTYVDRELNYLTGNPHAKRLLEVCALAKIQFGRIDYSVDREGNLQIWEINTNPQILPLIADEGLAAKRARTHELFSAGFIAALRDLDASSKESGPETTRDAAQVA